MQDVEITLSHVSKKYCKELRRSMRYGIVDICRNTIGMGSKSHLLRKDEFWAVKDVSFEVSKGEALGLIGANGSGKSTVLKMLNGIFWPDIGKVGTKGKVGALIEVGAGFHPMLTGRENVYLNGAILGMTQAEVKEKFDEIVDFAEIGDFLDTPVKHYSSGMFVKLGFSVAAHCDLDILLVDEVLAVGDVAFKRKCFKRLKELRDENVTWIIVSHDVNIIKTNTDRVVLLNRGEMEYIGSPEDAISEYLYSAAARNVASAGVNISPLDSLSFGHHAADLEVDRVALLDENLRKKDTFTTGEPLAVKIEFTAKKEIRDPTFGLAFFNGDNEICAESLSKYDGCRIHHINGRGSLIFKTDSLPLYPGVYRLQLNISDANFGPIVEILGAAYIKVQGGKSGKGMFYIPHSWHFEQEEPLKAVAVPQPSRK